MSASSSPPDLSAKLAQLRERFSASMDGTIAAFDALGGQLTETPAAAEAIEQVGRLAHRVHGTAGTYGFHDASRLAAGLELVAMRWRAEPAPDRARRGDIVRRFARRLSEIFLASTPDSPAPVASRLLLVDLPDGLAAPLIAECLAAGHAPLPVTAGDLGREHAAARTEAIVAGSPRAVELAAAAAVAGWTVPDA